MVQGLKDKAELQVADLSGQIILDMKDQVPVNGVYEKIIDLSSHPKGIYLLKLINQNNVVVRKLILE